MRMHGSYDPIVFQRERGKRKEVLNMKRAYLLRDVDPELFKEFKTACAFYGLSMREVLIKHMQNIAHDYNQVKGDLKRIKEYRNKEAKK